MMMADINFGPEHFDTIQKQCGEFFTRPRAEAKTSKCMWRKAFFDKIVWAKREEFWSWLMMMKSKINPSTLSAPSQADFPSPFWAVEC